MELEIQDKVKDSEVWFDDRLTLKLLLKVAAFTKCVEKLQVCSYRKSFHALLRIVVRDIISSKLIALCLVKAKAIQQTTPALSAQH